MMIPFRKQIMPYYHSLQLARKYKGHSLYKRLSITLDYYKLYRLKGLNINEYYEFEFEKQDYNFRKTFLGLNEQRYYLDYLNPKKYYSLARNKYLAHKMLENTGVQKTPLYCYYQPEGSFGASDCIASNINDVFRILKAKNVFSCVIKDTENSHGEGVIVIKKIEYQQNECLLHSFNGKILKLSQILGKYPLLFEGMIRQTKQLASFNESSVNTVRFMTTLYPSGEARVMATFIKIGRDGKCVDNAGDGGNVDACVDIDSGELKNVIRYDGIRNVTSITHHPDSNNKLDGVKIDNWEGIKAQVINFQKAFPYIKAAGWDIAITDNGPIVIEVNDMWDRTGQLFIRKGWREEIRECYLTWLEYNMKNKVTYPFERQLNLLDSSTLNRIVYNEF